MFWRCCTFRLVLLGLPNTLSLHLDTLPDTLSLHLDTVEGEKKVSRHELILAKAIKL